MSLLSIDPGLKVLGWAYWDCGSLVRCGLSVVGSSSVEVQAVQHKYNIHSYIQTPADRVSEVMTWRGGRAKTSPADLLKINIIAGHLANQWVTPQQWKGSVPKSIHHKRIKAKLTPRELDLLENVSGLEKLKHNVVDAVGIGLYALGRLKGGDK